MIRGFDDEPMVVTAESGAARILTTALFMASDACHVMEQCAST